MDKVAALGEIITDARNNQLSTTSARRVVRACRALGLSDSETVAILSRLDYCDHATGEPYGRNIKRVW